MHETEIERVHSRCKTCGQATHFVVNVWEGDDTSEHFRMVPRVEAVEHTRRDCEAMQRLEREAWPTLW